MASHRLSAALELTVEEAIVRAEEASDIIQYGPPKRKVVKISPSDMLNAAADTVINMAVLENGTQNLLGFVFSRETTLKKQFTVGQHTTKYAGLLVCWVDLLLASAQIGLADGERWARRVCSYRHSPPSF